MAQPKSGKSKELVPRKADEFKIEFPQTDAIEEKVQKQIQDAVIDGGIAVGNKTYINGKKLPILLNTDKKGAQIVLNDAPNDDVYQNGADDYLSTPHLQKEFSKRREQPRSLLEREHLKYASDCVEAFSNNSQLCKERTLQSDKIRKERPRLGAKTIGKRKATAGELSGEPLNGKGEVHHITRVADCPEKALNSENLVVLTHDEHSEFHSSKYQQDASGFQEFKKNFKGKKKDK